MDHEKPEMKSEKEGMEDSRAKEDKSDRFNIEEEHIGTNPENEPARAQQPFFVADTGELEDNESMIIPSSQGEDSELMIPSTPACADTSDRKIEEVNLGESTVSVLEETCIDLDEKAGPIEPSKEFSNQAACIESDMTQDLSELQPTQPIVSSNIEIDHPFNKSPVDTNKKKSEEDDDDDSWHLKFSETQTQDLMCFQKDDQQDEEPETCELPKQPETEADVDDDDDLPATLSIEVPPRIDVEGDYYKMKDKESESSNKVESMEADVESDDEIEPSQSCLSEYKGETICLSYKVQSNVDASNNEPSTEDIPTLSSERVTKIEDIDIIDSEKRTVNLSESGSVNVIDEFKCALGDRTLSIEELPIDGVEDNKEKGNPLKDAVKKKTKDSEEIVVEELVKEKPVKKSSFEYPLKFYDKEAVKIKEINGSQIEDITLSEAKMDEETPQKNEELKSIAKDVPENSVEHSKKMPAGNLKLSSEVTQDLVEIENNRVENDGEAKEYDEISKKLEKSVVKKNCESEIIEIDNLKKKPEVSKQDLSKKTEISLVESQHKSDVELVIDEKKKDSEVEETNFELDANKSSGEYLQQNVRQTIDKKIETPPHTFALPPVPDRSFASLKKQKVQNTSYQDSSVVERYDRKLQAGSCKDIKSLEKFFKPYKSIGAKIDKKLMEKFLGNPNEEIKFKPVFTFVDNLIFLEEFSIEFEHPRDSRDSGISPICSSSTATSSTLSSKISIHSGEMADVSSLSSGKSNSCGIQVEMSAHILSSQDTSFPKTSTQKSPKSAEFPEDFGVKDALGKLKVDSKASPIAPEQPIKVTKSKRNRKNVESSTSELPVSNEPKNKKRKTKSKVKVLEEKSETESSSKDVVEEKPRKPTRRKKGMIIPDIKPEEIKALIENIDMSTEDDSSMQEEANFGNILPGVKVMARWKDGYYYSGMVQSQEMDGKWAVLFEDGYIRTISPECLIKVAILPKGTSVLVQSPDDFYDPGIVCGHFREGNKVGYEVELDNGVTKRYPRSAVTLSNDQAKLLMSNRPPTTPASLTINLDNIVDGKRKRKPVQSPLAATSPVIKRVTRSKKPDSNLDTDVAAGTTSVESSRDSEAELPPVKKKKTTKKDAEEASTSALCIAPTAVASTSTSKNSKNSRARPPRMVTLFKDYAFLLTNADRKVVPKPLPAFTSDSSQESIVKEDEDIVPFDKEELEKHIAAGGGIVLEKFDDIKKCSRKHIYLLANSYVRTMKYIQCIAAGISCIKHHWVQNCITMSKILDLKSYILPAGYSFVTQQVIEWHGKTDIFKGCKIALVSDPECQFVYAWAPVLLAAKADFVQKWSLPSSVSGSSLVVDVLITNAKCPSDIIQSAKRRKVPIVSSEWVIQCLIMGKKLPYDSHPKFKYDYTEI